jgi:outer membrane protein
MKRNIAALSILLAASLHADVIGGEVSLGYLNLSPSGTFAYKGNSADVEKSFGWSDESGLIFKGYIEHPVPVIPNIRLSYTNLSFSGSGTVTGLKYGDKTFSGKIDSKFDADVADATLYYEILDNWVNLDLGLNAKYIDGSACVKNSIVGRSKADFTVVLPTLYAKARFDIPMSDISFQAEGDIVSYDDNTLYDLTLSARYTFALGVGLEAGFKTIKFKIDDIDDVTVDVDFTGGYAAVVWDF